jgi:hypothetical protein
VLLNCQAFRYSKYCLDNFNLTVSHTILFKVFRKSREEPMVLVLSPTHPKQRYLVKKGNYTSNNARKITILLQTI